MYKFKFLIGAVLLLITLQVSAMSLFGFKVCLATEVKGVVTLQGKPVANAKVTREVLFRDQKLNSETITDEKGNFSLPAVYERTVWKHTPFEVVIGQTINIEFENKQYLAFRTSKRNFDVDGELNSPIAIENGQVLTPFILACELTNEEWLRARKEGDSHAIRGICLIPGETIEDMKNKVE
jgi:hypothetical protein